MSHPQKRSRSESFEKDELSLPIDVLFEELVALRDEAELIIRTGLSPSDFNLNKYDKKIDKVLEKIREKWDGVIISLEGIVDDCEKTKSDEEFVVDSDEATESDYEPSEEEDCETISETESDAHEDEL